MNCSKRSASTQDDMSVGNHNDDILDNPAKKMKCSSTPTYNMKGFSVVDPYEDLAHHHAEWKNSGNGGETDSSLTGYSEDQTCNSTNTSLSTSATSYGPYLDRPSNHSCHEDSSLKLDVLHDEWLQTKAQQVLQIVNANLFDIPTELDYSPRRVRARMSTSRLRQRPSRLDLLDHEHYTCFSDMMTPIRSSPHNTVVHDSPTPTVSSCGSKSKSLVFVGDYFSPLKPRKSRPQITAGGAADEEEWRCASCLHKLSGSRDSLKNQTYEVVLCQSCAASECGAQIEHIHQGQQVQAKFDHSPYPISSAQLSSLLLHHEEAVAGGSSHQKNEWLKTIRHKVRWRWRVRGLLPASMAPTNNETR